MQNNRQSELFLSKDWLVLYQAFTQVNFNASDPNSINQSLRDYIAVNYPEDFNDWIESSEFVAIIDLLSWLAGTLAFKMDINSRENFLETAEARESVLRLARFLSYNPRRNRPATGMVKLVEVSTDDDIRDSTGTNLAGVKVQWNNADDPDWFERFTTVMSSAFTNTNPFGTPLKTGLLTGIPTQLYRVNCLMGANNFAFSTSVGGEGMDFELCNGDFNDLGSFNERAPDASAAFNLFYRNDGNGNNSARTGFFMLFKQGSTVRQTFRIDTPVENQLLDLDVGGVNENDVWVQTVDENSQVLIDWTKVPAIFSENITYNNVNADNRNIFSVLTRDQDRVSIRFSDGIFGTAPVGNIMVSHRVSNGRQYQVRPTDINRITQSIRYFNRAGILRTLKLTFSLQEPVLNAAPRETDEQIRQRAPGTYAAQNRMVSGEDYNSFPLSSNLATKLKAVNRVYSGHSRFIDLNDPTATYTDVVVNSDDGMLYRETANVYAEVPLSLNRTPAEMISAHLQPIVRSLNVRSYVNDTIFGRVSRGANNPDVDIPAGTSWKRSTSAKFSSSGALSHSSLYFREGSQLKFELPNGEFRWASIAVLTDNPTTIVPANTRGPVTLSEDIPTGSRVVSLLPGFSSELPTETFLALVARFGAASARRGFSLWFDPEQDRWLIRDEVTLLSAADNTNDAIHVLTAEFYAGSLWKFAARGTKYVFESERKVKWFSDSNNTVDSETGLKKNDTVTVLRSNPDLREDYAADGRGIVRDRAFNVSALYYYGDGAQEPRRVQVDFTDVDGDGSPDDPEAVSFITDLPDYQGTLFWQLGESYGQPCYKPTREITVFAMPSIRFISQIPPIVRFHRGEGASDIAFASGDICYVVSLGDFFERVNDSWQTLPRRNFRIAKGRGANTAKRWVVIDPYQRDDDRDGNPDGGGTVYQIAYSRDANEVAAQYRSADEFLIRDGSLAFKWKHYAPSDHRIDPAITNIIDTFVLSTEYDYATRLWIANGAKITDLPKAPTELDLRLTFAEYDQQKVFSDQIVWRPVSYKLLFGNGSEPQNLRARFKVIKLPISNVADGEVKSRVIAAVNEFFAVSRWDFGETFYFTELAAFIHQRLAGVIGSVVIVPMDEEASFGEGFEVRCRTDEIFISTAQVSDVEIINSNTTSQLRIR
jgi:hypothetical protein